MQLRKHKIFWKLSKKSKDCELYAFIYALGIPNVGVKTAKDLVSRFKSIEGLKNATFEELVGVQDVGDIVAQGLWLSLKRKRSYKQLKNY